MTTHAPLRSRRTKAQSVCHVRGLRDGDSPTSPLKDTRLLAVSCRVEPVVTQPAPPQTRTCPIQASGSSVARASARLWCRTLATLQVNSETGHDTGCGQRELGAEGGNPLPADGSRPPHAGSTRTATRARRPDRTLPAGGSSHGYRHTGHTRAAAGTAAGMALATGRADAYGTSTTPLASRAAAASWPCAAG